MLELVKTFYKWLILLVIGFMLLHNGLDFIHKMWEPPEVDPEEFDHVRLNANERVQHALLMVSFILLAYSGFALKYPDAAWAQFLAPFAEATRRAMHRKTALVFCLLGVYHVFYLLGTTRGRTLLKALLPVWGDAKAMIHQLAWSVGLRKSPPKPTGFYHYPEKMEYWALVWGSFVMVTTGAILVFANLTLKHLPVWVPDLATLVHYYEAVLACLAIIVWHGYLVIFDPKIYPMSWAWLTGRIRRKRGK